MRKQYTNGNVTLVWRPEKCIHRGECTKGLAEVFRPRETPWIQLGTVSNGRVIAQVNQCPSGAIATKQ